MANVVRFTLPTARTLNVRGAGQFITGVLDVDVNNPTLVTRTRYLVKPYGAVEVGVVAAGTAYPTLPAVPATAPFDPYPQYVTDAEMATAIAGVVAGSVPDATTTIKGIVELATNAETTTGTDTVRAVTPAGVKAVGDTKAAASHTHGVTDLTATGTKDTTTYLRGDNTWAVPAGGGGGASDATTSAKGIVQLAGDLAGTAAAPTVPGLAAKAPIASPTFTGTVSGVTKAMVGLGSVDNTADTAKPVSTAQATAITAATPDASATVKGLVELATTAETQAGTDTVRAITPAAAAATFVTQANAIDLESTQDSVAGMFTGGTHSGIAFAYDDTGAHVNATVTPGAIADATTTAKGAVQLAGHLGGTAAAPTVLSGAGHTHTATQVSDSTATGRSLITATDAAAARTVTGAAAASHTHVATTDLTATGTKNSTTFLRGDNTWATPAGGGGSTPVDLARSIPPTGTIAGVYVETFPRWTTGATSITLTTGVPRFCAITLRSGEVVTSVSFQNGGGALGTGTHQWVALCDTAGTVLAVSADATSTAWAGSVPKTFAMTSPYTVSSTGIYYIVLCIVATTLPGPMCVSQGGTIATGLLPWLCGTAATNTGAPPAVSDSIGTLAATAGMLYAAVA